MNLKLSEFIINSLTSKEYSDRRFFLHRDKYRIWRYTFKQVYEGSKRFADLLEDMGLSRGDHVLIKCSNSPEWVVAFIGCILKRYVVVPLDTGSSPDFDLKVNAKVKAKVIVADDRKSCTHFKGTGIRELFLGQISGLLNPFLSEGKIFGRSAADISENSKGIYPDNKHSGAKADDLLEIIFTSGTTTEPKGVMITYKNVGANLESVQEVMKKYDRIFRVMAGPKILSLVPLSHMYGQLIGIFTPLMIGSSVMFTGNLSPNYVMKVIKEEKIWILGILPKLLEMLKNHIILKFGLDNERFISLFKKMKKKRWQIRLARFLHIHIRIGWRLVALMIGGAVLDPSVDEFWRCLAYSIFQGYGLTETAPLVTLSDPIGSYPGSIGKILPGQNIRIVEGELYIRGPNVSGGYFKDDKRSREAFKDGWFRTGDLVEVDKNGNVFFKGRKDDLIVRSSGLNVFPEDIENRIKATGAVKDCVVIGVRSNGTDNIWAVLLLKEGIKTSPESIIRKANSGLSAYQKVDNFFVWDELDFPRTPTMKVKKKEVIESLNKRISSKKSKVPVSTMNGHKLSGISRIITRLHETGRHVIRPGDRLEDDVGLDSLELIELTSEIEEKYNVDLDDAVITKDTTVEELEKIISSPPGESRRLPFYSFPYWTAVRIIRTIFQYILLPFISVLYISKIKGRENLRGLKGPVVFAANHSSNLDTFVMMYSLPLKIRYWLATLMSIEYHFQNFFYRKGSWIRRFIEGTGFYLLVNLAINACPLSRTHGFKQVLENVGKLIDRGWSILIYPEGMVTTDGKIHGFESGIGIIAADMKVPVVPVRIEGLYNILRDGILPWGHKPKWPRVTITFGKPVLFRDKKYQEIAGELEDIIKNRL